MARQADFKAAGGKISRAMNKIRGRHVKQTAAGIGNEIFRDIHDNRVPVDKGTLQRTGRVEAKPGETIIAFGGKEAPYAVAVHELLNHHHDHGEARYLVRGVEAWRESTSPTIAAAKRDAKRAIAQENR
jgi:hypothetical protein